MRGKEAIQWIRPEEHRRSVPSTYTLSSSQLRVNWAAGESDSLLWHLVVSSHKRHTYLNSHHLYMHIHKNKNETLKKSVSISSFLRNFHTDFYIGYTGLHSHKQGLRDSLANIQASICSHLVLVFFLLLLFCFFFVLFFSHLKHSSWGKIKSQSSCNLQFLMDRHVEHFLKKMFLISLVFIFWELSVYFHSFVCLSFLAHCIF